MSCSKSTTCRPEALAIFAEVTTRYLTRLLRLRGDGVCASGLVEGECAEPLSWHPDCSDAPFDIRLRTRLVNASCCAASANEVDATVSANLNVGCSTSVCFCKRILFDDDPCASSLLKTSASSAATGAPRFRLMRKMATGAETSSSIECIWLA